MACEVLGQEGIGFGSGDGSQRVLAVLILWVRESDQRGGKFHLCVRAAQVERFFYQRVAVDAGGGILLVFRITHPALADPLFVGFREIAGIEPGQRVGVAEDSADVARA